jgi:hypothetical protein
VKATAAKVPASFPYQIESYLDFGRISLGGFAEGELDDVYARVLASWWREIALGHEGPCLVWLAQSRQRWSRQPVEAVILPRTTPRRTWHERGLLRTTQHELRAVNGETFTTPFVRSLWQASCFGLVGASDPDAVDEGELLHVAATLAPTNALLSSLRYLVVPSHHRLWLDLYCGAAEADANEQRLAASLATVGVEAKRVEDLY